jgi:hypothetical protein
MPSWTIVERRQRTGTCGRIKCKMVYRSKQGKVCVSLKSFDAMVGVYSVCVGNTGCKLGLKYSGIHDWIFL